MKLLLSAFIALQLVPQICILEPTNCLKLNDIVFDVNVYDEDTLSIDNQLTRYFYNLTENIPNNQAGSCGFVSMAMVLAYYDIYYNDSIVPNNSMIQYGIYNQTTQELNTSSGAKYFEYQSFNYSTIISNYLNDLQCELIKIAIDLGVISSNSTTFGLYTGDVNTILQKYLDIHNLNDILLLDTRYNHCVSNGSNVLPQWGSTTWYNESTSMESNISSLIRQGYPVITSVYGASYGHTIVSYDTSSANHVYSHFGFKPDNNLQYSHSTYYTVDQDPGIGGISNALPYYYNEYTVLIPYETIQNNFSFTNNVTYALYSPQTSHFHSWTSITYSNLIRHKLTCYCGYSKYQTHTIVSGQHFDYCTVCGHAFNGSGPIITNKNEQNH